MPSDIHEYAGVHRDPNRLGRHPRVDRETFVCAVRGHVTPAGDVARLRPEDAAVGVDLEDGRRFARCLRCDAWLETAHPATPSRETLPPLAEIELPRRGKALRDAIVLRLISIDRGLHCVIFGLLAFLFLDLDRNLGAVRSSAGRLLTAVNDIASNSGQGGSHNFLSSTLTDVLHLRSHTLLVLGITSIVYCVVEGTEAVGLWRERRWAEYLTALATAGFLPFEVHELATRVTVLRIVALVVNVAILLYLLYAKRLFGIRGGTKADEEAIDRDELFAIPGETGAGAAGAARERRATRR